MCSIRDYQPADYDACLGVFASNVPLFFGPDEQTGYTDFLVRLPCPYLVVEVEGRVVGCGGFYLLPGGGSAGLAWGMVARDVQRRGIGTALLEARLQRLSVHQDVRTVRIKTSQHTAPFFQRFGFRIERIVENHFAPGLHQYQMFLDLVSRREPGSELEKEVGPVV